jgi:recombination protein RecT
MEHTATTTSLAERVHEAAADGPPRPGKTVKDLVKAMLPRFAGALPASTVSPERFLHICLSEFSKTPDLMNCTQESLLGALMTVAQLGLEVGGGLGQAYLLPYRNKRQGVTECQLIIGYKGWIELAARSNIKIEALDVHENDEFDFSFGTDCFLKHKWKLGRDRGEVIGYYAKAKFADGDERFLVMDLADIEKRKVRSQVRSDRGPWATDPEAMSKKSVIRAMIPQLPLSSEFGQALEADDAIVHLRGEKTTVEHLDAGTATGDPLAEKREQVTNLVLGHPNRETGNWLVHEYGPVPDLTEAQLDEVIEKLTPEVAAAIEAESQTFEEEVIVGSASQQDIDRVFTAVQGWDDARLHRVMDDWSVPKTGSLKIQRVRCYEVLLRALTEDDPGIVEAVEELLA